MEHLDIKDKIDRRIEDLKNKIENLVLERQELSKRLEDINTELTQIVGALRELSYLRESDDITAT